MRDLDLHELCRHAGIVCDPSYYSGRGATTSDLNDRILQKAHDMITQRLGFEAAAAYVRMVASLPVASATGYLRGLYELAGNGWTWPEGQQGHGDIYAGSEGSGFATIINVMTRPQDGDEREHYEARQRQMTATIRGAFLRRHGVDNNEERAGWLDYFPMPERPSRRSTR